MFLTFHCDYYHIIHPLSCLIGTWFVPRFLLLWVVLWTFFYMSLLNMHKNVLSIYVGGDNAKLFSKVITLIYTPTRNVGYLGTYVFFYPRYQLTFFPLSPFLPSFLLFIHCHFHRFKTVSHSSLDSHFSDH